MSTWKLSEGVGGVNNGSFNDRSMCLAATVIYDPVSGGFVRVYWGVFFFFLITY